MILTDQVPWVEEHALRQAFRVRSKCMPRKCLPHVDAVIAGRLCRCALCSISQHSHCYATGTLWSTLCLATWLATGELPLPFNLYLLLELSVAAILGIRCTSAVTMPTSLAPSLQLACTLLLWLWCCQNFVFTAFALNFILCRHGCLQAGATAPFQGIQACG